MHLYGTGKINNNGHLEIGGIDTVELAKNMEHLYMCMMWT